MPDLIWSPRSDLDVADIDADFSKRDLAIAVRALRAVQSAAARLVEYSRLGWSVGELLRVVSVRATPYLILYRLRNGVVEGVRVRHARENCLGETEAEL